MRFLIIILLLFATAKSADCQVVYFGVTKLSLSQSLKSVNGTWNTADKTGNTEVDKFLGSLVAKYKQLNMVKAIETSVAHVRADPQKFINPDGSVNTKALGDLLSQKFSTIAKVTIPADSLVQAEGSMNDPR